MKAMMRKASVRWIGGARDGSGDISTESGALQGFRFSSGAPVNPSGLANPAELIAAAHAGSFSMALAEQLGAAGFVPDHINTVATVTLERLTVGWTVTNINLKVLANVPTAAQTDFIDATLRAKTGCLISRLLSANISLNAKLESIPPKVASRPLPRPEPNNPQPQTRPNHHGKTSPTPRLRTSKLN